MWKKIPWFFKIPFWFLCGIWYGLRHTWEQLWDTYNERIKRVKRYVPPPYDEWTTSDEIEFDYAFSLFKGWFVLIFSILLWMIFLCPWLAISASIGIYVNFRDYREALKGA